jgi:SAM-dependent methyltransferase
MIPRAEGVVVEVGFGSGLNLPYYDPSKVTRLVGVDPDETMLSLAKRQSRAVPFAMECLQAGAESMPLADGFADTAVVAYALCTIPEPQKALAEIHRILKPGGRLVFLEHGQAEPGLCKGIQNRLNRFWGALAGGCNLNRDPVGLVRDAGFDVREAGREKFPPSSGCWAATTPASRQRHSRRHETIQQSLTPRTCHRYAGQTASGREL